MVFLLLFEYTMHPFPVLASQSAGTVVVAKENNAISSIETKPGSNIASSTISAATSSDQVMPKVLKTEKRRLSAYNSEAAQTDSSPCITANGFNVCKHGIEDTVASNSLPFGAKIRIPELFGDRVFVVRDRMNPRYKNNIDIWFKDKRQAINFGRRTASVEILDI